MQLGVVLGLLVCVATLDSLPKDADPVSALQQKPKKD